MTANYNFQHNVLRQAFESLPTHELKSIIITQDTARAKEIFYSAMEKSHLGLFNEIYNFNCNFIIKNKIPILIYYFDNSVINGMEIVGECFASVVVAKDENHYYTLEYSFENNLAIGEWANGNHVNHGFYLQNDMENIIDSICNLCTEKDLYNFISAQNITSETNTLNSSINKIKKIQLAMAITLGLLLIFMVVFPITAVIIKNEAIYWADSKELTKLNANQKVYCDTSYHGSNIIYIKESGRVNRYGFANTTMYYGSKIQKGRATSSEIKEYFGSNVTPGKPPLTYTAPAVLPIGITCFVALITIIIFLSVILHRRTQAILFTLTRQNESFIKNKEAFDNEIISEYEYNKIKKSLLSQKILKNNKLFSLFKYLY